MMGAKQNYLAEICYKRYGIGKHNKPDSSVICNSNLYKEIALIYGRLGGILEIPPLRIGKYDIDLMNFIIELDEENHFNRYRLITLDSEIYKGNNNIDIIQYTLFCKQFENKCCKHGGYWNNPSSDKQFGTSRENGVLLGSGSSRWKQRAFYDFIKDVGAVITNTPIIRVSIYERYNNHTVESLIVNQNKDALMKFIDNKYEKAFK